MPINLTQLVVRNWPIKLAALFFALMLYVAVAAQQPVTEAITLNVAVEGPPGRAPKEQPRAVVVLISGRGNELLKLRSLPRSITKVIPDTFSGSVWRTRLQTSDVPLPTGADVEVNDISPRELEVDLDSAMRKEVRIVHRVTMPV